MNLTNIRETPVHIAFDEVCKKAADRGIRVTGSELVGLVPLSAMLEAGRYFLRKQKRSTGVGEKELIRIAVKSMGLDELAPFKPEERIIEYMLQSNNSSRLVNMNLEAFAAETASESPAPGGGSIAAYVGALGVALGTMVANLSAHKKGWDSRWDEFSTWADQGQELMQQLIHCVDEDTRAFNRIMEAMQLPKGTDAEKEKRQTAMDDATRYAIEVPLKVMRLCYRSLDVIEAMAQTGNPNSVSDAGVGALCARAGVWGAYMNVQINAAGFSDTNFTQQALQEGKQMLASALEREAAILKMVEEKIGS